MRIISQVNDGIIESMKVTNRTLSVICHGRLEREINENLQTQHPSQIPSRFELMFKSFDACC